MIRKTFLSCSIFAVAAAIACSSANNDAATNANTATVVNSSTANPIGANAIVAVPSPAANSAVPGIPNAPANAVVKGGDMTRSAKPQLVARAAPDNSETTMSLGENLVETRIFKNNAQIAKVERITETANAGKKRIKVYLRNGQVRELPEGKVGDVMSETGANIFKAVSESGTPSEPTKEPEPAAQNQTQPAKDRKRPPFAKQQ